MKKNKKKLLVITPIDQIDGLKLKIKKNFKCKYLKNPSYKEVYKIINKFDYLFTNPNMSNFFIDKKLIHKGLNLKCICTASTGTNHIDLNYCKKKKIKILSLKSQKNIINKISSTAELAFCLMLVSLRKVVQASKSVLNFKWSYLNYIGDEVKSKKIGVLGYGRLGKFFSRYCMAFGAKIYVYDPYKKIKSKSITKIKKLENFLKKIDILSVHIHLTKKNKNFINKNNLKFLKNNILIVNTSRGQVINESDLLTFLKKNKTAKYATDVISDELNLNKKNKMLKFYKKNINRIIVTPHIGGMTQQGQHIAYHGALNNLIKYHR